MELALFCKILLTFNMNVENILQNIVSLIEHCIDTE